MAHACSLGLPNVRIGGFHPRHVGLGQRSAAVAHSRLTGLALELEGVRHVLFGRATVTEQVPTAPTIVSFVTTPGRPVAFVAGLVVVNALPFGDVEGVTAQVHTRSDTILSNLRGHQV